MRELFHMATPPIAASTAPLPAMRRRRESFIQISRCRILWASLALDTGSRGHQPTPHACHYRGGVALGYAFGDAPTTVGGSKTLDRLLFLNVAIAERTRWWAARPLYELFC